MYMNQLTIVGFTGNDAETHYTTSGTLVTTLSVATKESWKNADGEWQSRTEWHRVVAFGKLAEYARILSKGSHLMVQGAVRSREYDRDGVKHRIFELRADTIAKLDRAERRQDTGADLKPRSDGIRGSGLQPAGPAVALGNFQAFILKTAFTSHASTALVRSSFQPWRGWSRKSGLFEHRHS